VAEAPTTRKVQLSVPTADTTVAEWLDLQYSASESIRRLIRESVAREGFTDVANRPVRPPANPVYVAESFPADVEEPSEEPPAPKAAAKTAKSPASEASAPEAAAPKPAPRKTETDDDADDEPSTPTRRSVRSENTDATATIDDLLGL